MVTILADTFEVEAVVMDEVDVAILFLKSRRPGNALHFKLFLDGMQVASTKVTSIREHLGGERQVEVPPKMAWAIFQAARASGKLTRWFTPSP